MAGVTAPGPINAQAEHLESSKYFRGAFHQHRCLIPADGWYEWQPHAGGKIPYYFSRSDSEPLFLAGIYETMKNGNLCCAIVTMPARGGVRDIHPRMPLVLDDSCLSSWLDHGLQDRDSIQAAVKPLGINLLTCWQVSTNVNRTANDGPELIEPIPSS